MAEVNLTLGDPIEVKVSPAEGATNVSVASAPQNVVQVQAAIATNGLQGAAGVGVPSGGEEGLFLVKLSDSDHDTGWGYVHTITEVVKNETGGTLNKGTAVHIDGEDASGNPIVVKADNDDPNRMPCHFVLNETIEDGQTGEGIVSGMISGVNTNFGGFQSGDTVYVGAEGGYVKTKPSGSDKKVQNIAVISHVDGSQGTAYIMGAGRSNDIPNLDSGHFFLGGATGTTSPYELPISSPTNGQLLKANAEGNLVFVNANEVTKNIGTVDLTTTNTTRNLDIIEDGHLNIRDAQNDPILYIDEATKRVGINTTTLDKDAALFINGNVLFKDDSTIGVEGGQSFTIGKIGSAAGVAAVNVTGDLSVSGNCTVDTNLKFGTGGNQLHANTNNTFEFGKNGSGSANYKFNSDVGTVTFDNTTDVEIKNAGGLKIFNSSNSVSIQAPSLASSYTLTLPNSSGTDGYVLKTDGSGTTSWVDVTAVSDAILDSDFDDEDSGLMKKTGDGTYAIASSQTDYQVPPAEMPFADGDKTKLDRINVSSDVDLDNAIYTSTDNVSSASFVDTDDTFDSATDNLVPSQLAVKTYVDSHRKAAVYVDQSDAPQLHASVSEAEMKSLLNLEDADIRGLINVGASLGSGSLTYNASLGSLIYNGPTDDQIRAPFGAASSGSGSLTYSASTGVFTYTGPDLSSYLTSVSSADVTAHEADLTIATTQLTGLSATGEVSGITLSQTNGAFTLGGSISITESQISDLQTYLTGSSSTSDLSDVNGDGTADGQLLIYNQSAGKYDVNTLTGGDNVTITQGAGTITIATTSGTMDNVVDDASPQLGGPLDTNQQAIVSASDNNIDITPNGSGEINLNKTVNVEGDLTLRDGDQIQLGDAGEATISFTADNRVEYKADLHLFTGQTSTGKLIDALGGAGVRLYNAGSAKLTTVSDGVEVSGLVKDSEGFLTDFSTILGAGEYVGADLVEQVYSSGTAVTLGNIYYMGPSAWTEAHADSEADASGLLGIATSTDQNGKFVTKGLMRVNGIQGTGVAKGKIVYLSAESDEAGKCTVERPSADGEIVRILGYVVGNNLIYFNPSPDYIEIA